jgi:hypothetical protein
MKNYMRKRYGKPYMSVKVEMFRTLAQDVADQKRIDALAREQMAAAQAREQAAR